MRTLLRRGPLVRHRDGPSRCTPWPRWAPRRSTTRRLRDLSIDNLREVVIKAIRYLCFTHDTGPEECLRPSTGLGMPRSWGTKWGERGRGFFPESQCGGTVANMTSAALMLQPYVDDETRMMLAEICLDYLDRFGDMAPEERGISPIRRWKRTRGRRTDWRRVICFCPDTNMTEAWETCARRWMFSACATPQDRFKRGGAGIRVDGRCADRQGRLPRCRTTWRKTTAWSTPGTRPPGSSR